MARIDTLKNFLVDIADKFRSVLGTTEAISHAEYDAKIDEVYEAGKDKMLSDMWDMIQGEGNRTIYQRAFSEMKLSKSTFKPKYNFNFYNAQYMFMDAYGDILDLDAIEKECGIAFNFSNITTLAGAFQSANVEKVNVIDGSKATSLNYLFAGTNNFKPSNIKWVNKLVVNPSATFTNAFNYCTLLEHIIFEGTIGQSGLNTSACTLLDKESHISIVNCLSGTVSVTLSKTAVNKAFETSEGANDGSTSAEWATLIASKPNNTISLV